VVLWEKNDSSVAPTTNQVLLIVVPIRVHGVKGREDSTRTSRLLKSIEGAFRLTLLEPRLRIAKTPKAI